MTTDAPLAADLVTELRQMAATGYAGCAIWAEAADEIDRLRGLLSDAADPVSCQLAEARRNLELYKGYSSRERRYQIEIEQLERLQKAIGTVTRG